VKHKIDRPGNKDKLGNVVPDKPKIGIARQMLNVVGPARDKVVNRDDAESLRNQAVTKMGTKESCASGNDGCFLRRFRLEHGGEAESELGAK
jgi:hypothetical protein